MVVRYKHITKGEIEGELIVRIDVRETHGGFVWTIYWQEPDDGEA